MRRHGLSALVLGAGLAGLSVVETRAPERAHEAPRAKAVAPSAGVGVWRADEVMVRAATGSELAEIARSHGTWVAREAGPSGYGALAAPLGTDALLDALSRDPRVGGAAPNGVIEGTGRPGSGAGPQWHLDAARVPAGEVSQRIVAVLDSGVAYEDRGRFVRAPSLAGTTFVHPLDLVDGDGHPNDEHQHGTHVASVIASRGVVRGVAPGVAILPVRVLDAHNAGTELDLVDGIHHAVAHGADVINMSLSFRAGYVPSRALLDALALAWDEGVVMVAAAGNDGADWLSWPAASPYVIGVAGSRPVDLKTRAQVAAPYSNLATGVDLSAPGGSIDGDATGDGRPDGVLAETIAPGDPSRTGLWYYAGTSQAAAITSGAAVRLLDAGVPPWDVGPALQRGAWRPLPEDGALAAGGGLGDLDVTTAIRNPPSFSAGRWHVAMLPFLADLGGGEVAPAAWLSVVDDVGEPPSRPLDLWVQVHGEGGGALTCRARPGEGSCVVVGEPADADAPLAWAFSADAVLTEGHTRHPLRALFATDALEVAVAALEADPLLQDALLAFEWSADDDPELGPVAPSLAVVDLGSGLASSPLGIVLSPRLVTSLGTSSTVALDLDGTGLASSPLGFIGVKLVRIDGSGLASSPLGLRDLKLVAFHGTGLASSPLGFTALSLFDRRLSAGSTDLGLGLNGASVLLVDGSGPAGAIGDTLASGGWTAGDGWQAASLLSATDVLELPSHAAGAGAVEAR